MVNYVGIYCALYANVVICTCKGEAVAGAGEHKS